MSSDPKVQQSAPVLSRELGERVECAATLRTAADKVREQPYDLLLLDEGLAQVEGAAVEGLLSHAPAAVPVFFNPAITGTKRLVQQVRAAQRLHEREQHQAMAAALAAVRNDLRSDVTAILISSQLAAKSPALPESSAAGLRSVCEAAERLSKKLA